MKTFSQFISEANSHLEEGMTMDDFKKQRRRQKEEPPIRKRGGLSAPEGERSIGGEANRRNKDYWASVVGKNRDRGQGSAAKRRASELNKEEFEIDEAYDKDVMGSSQIRRTGEGGRIGADRKKTAPERRRMRAAGGGKMEPAKEYKPRKDIGTQRQTSTRVQQPEKERGSAALSAKEAQRKAYLERKRREAGEKTKSASELLAKKKKATVSPDYKPQKASGKTTKERKALYKKGERVLRDLVLQSTGKKSEKELKNKFTSK